MKVTEEMVNRALAARTDLIQGFTYQGRDLPHVIRDFRDDKRGVEIYAGSDHAAMMRMLEQLKMAAQINAALTPADRDSK
jgi:hypothetical protein